MNEGPGAVFWICSAVSLGGGLLATLLGPIRYSALALWVAGIGVGGIFLSVGAEFLAVMQWIVSTLIGISFIFYSALFGDEEARKNRFPSPLAFVVGGVFVAAVWIGLRDLQSTPYWGATASAGNLLELGKTLVERHLLSLEILALTLFLVIIGAGVISRPEVREK